MALQTGVVIVVYCTRRSTSGRDRGGTLMQEDIRVATIAGSLLRSRTELMTVSVVMAGLMSILWSTVSAPA